LIYINAKSQKTACLHCVEARPPSLKLLGAQLASAKLRQLSEPRRSTLLRGSIMGAMQWPLPTTSQSEFWSSRFLGPGDGFWWPISCHQGKASPPIRSPNKPQT